MELYRVKIQLSSPLVTPLKGDTIWGHVAWGIANHEGDEAVQKFLDACKDTEPVFVVSSAFPTGFVCKPLPRPHARNTQLTPDSYAKIKKFKKERYVQDSDYFDTGDSVRCNGENPFSSVVLTHNSIDRFSNTVTDGGLYAVTEQWTAQQNFDIYIASSFDAERVRQLCEWAFENGFGADSSTGKGRISVLGPAEKVKVKKQADTYMALAPFVLPEDSAISELRADTFIRSGKIGGSFVSSLQPWKKTVVMFDEGAVFKSKSPLTFIGRLLTDVHSDSRICQSGFAPVIPISEE